MAYMNQEKKKALAPGIKAVCEKYGIKATLSVHHYSTLVLTIKEGAIDFSACLGDNNAGRYRVNTYHIERAWTGKARDFLMEVRDAMNVGNHDRSDIMTDYFDVGWYIDINVGKWDKPYIYREDA